MKKFFYSFLIILVVIITSIAYLGNINYSQINEYNKKASYSFLNFNARQPLQVKYLYESNHIVSNKEEENRYENDQSFQKAKKPDQTEKYNFLAKYKNVLDCSLNYSKWLPNESAENRNYNYIQPAPKELLDVRILKAVLVYFPIEKHEEFKEEFKWFYRSWIEMQASESKMWRTDIIVFIDSESDLLKKEKFFLNEMNCSFAHRRLQRTDNPMCSLLAYKPLKNRNITKHHNSFQSENDNIYEHLLTNLDIYNDDDTNLEPFYTIMKEKISHYSYIDSILMAFDGYSYFKTAGYDFLIRSDMDVFLTPLFGKWLPKNCNDFYVGRGGYSTSFNLNRLKRIAKDLGFKFAFESNLGSTWFSTPDQFRLVSYLTLFGMTYLSEEEFTPPERQGKLGVMLWPYWHYGVLLLYGQNLGLNHLIATKQLNVIKLEEHLDYPSYYGENINKMLHIHVFHGDSLFSKFQFKAGKYDALDANKYDTNIAKYYALKMALEGKRIAPVELFKLLLYVTKQKM
jgi:hypothetical protein